MGRTTKKEDPEQSLVLPQSENYPIHWAQDRVFREAFP